MSVLLEGCLPDPQLLQSRRLFDQLVEARTALGDRPPRFDTGCQMVGDAQTRLLGEPGLVDVRPAWSALKDSSDALSAVCGQAALLREATLESAATIQARARWQMGIARELDVACQDLREAAIALTRITPC
jgi:hypothetical protein